MFGTWKVPVNDPTCSKHLETLEKPTDEKAEIFEESRMEN